VIFKILISSIDLIWDSGRSARPECPTRRAAARGPNGWKRGFLGEGAASPSTI